MGKVSLLMVLMVPLVGCAAANRPQLPPRIIDDPATLPKGMLSLSGTAQRNSLQHPVLGGLSSSNASASMRFGIARRVELVNIAGVRVAALDDSPALPSPDQLTLAVTGGLADAQLELHPLVRDGGPTPFLTVDVGRRVAARLRLDGQIGQRTYSHDFREYALRPTVTYAGLGGLYQLSETVAARADLHAYRWNASERSWRPALQGGYGPGLWVGTRPRRWLTVGAYARLVQTWVRPEPPAPTPERTVADARVAYAPPRHRIAILGVDAAFHN